MAAVLNTHRSSLRVDKLSNRDMNLLGPRPTAPQHFWGPGRAGVARSYVSKAICFEGRTWGTCAVGTAGFLVPLSAQNRVM